MDNFVSQSVPPSVMTVSSVSNFNVSSKKSNNNFANNISNNNNSNGNSKTTTITATITTIGTA